MFRINVSDGMDNFSQRNNAIDPFNSCNVTSMVMAVSYIPTLWEAFVRSPYYSEYDRYFQPEDRFHQAMRDWGLNVQVHVDLMLGINKWLGFAADNFSVDVSLFRIIEDLKLRLPVVMSGDFPGHPVKREKPLGHIVCLVGAVWEKEDTSSFPEKWIIDDPYGNTMNNWQGSGNDVVIPHEFFNAWMKTCNNSVNKWAHRFLV